MIQCIFSIQMTITVVTINNGVKFQKSTRIELSVLDQQQMMTRSNSQIWMSTTSKASGYYLHIRKVCYGHLKAFSGCCNTALQTEGSPVTGVWQELSGGWGEDREESWYGPEGSEWFSALGSSVLTVDTEKYPRYVAWCTQAHDKSRMSLLWMR